MLARSKGLAADRVSKMRIALYDGSIIEATENNEHKDLWWALRGGGGGTFGIVTEFTIQAFSPEPVNTMFALFWEIGAARDLMTAWMAYFPSSDSRLVTQFNFYTDQVFLVGQFLGSKSELEIILSKSQMLGNNFNTNQFLINSTITEDCNALESKAFMWTFNCNSTDFITNSSSEIYRPETDVDHHKYKSEYFDTLPSNQDIENIISSIASAPNGSWLQLEALGGVFQNTSNSYTPYWHRQGVLFSMQYAAPMNSSDLSGLNWITKFELLLKDITNGHHYYNYIDRDLGSAVQAGLAYFGEDNFKRLVNVKRKYDPNNVFKNPQSIPVMI